MEIRWDENLKCGIAEIDFQHENFIIEVNQFLRNCREKKHGKETDDFMKFLDEHVEEHLSAEEKIQKQYSYPKFFLHRVEHLLFKRKLCELKKLFMKDGGTLRFSMLAGFVVSDWLVQHVNGEDRSFIQFLRNRRTGERNV